MKCGAAATAATMLVGATACAVAPQQAAPQRIAVEVQEMARAQHCDAAVTTTQVRIFPSPRALRDWAHNLPVVLPEVLPEAPLALVESGVQATGGYGIAVSRLAHLQGTTLTLQGTFIAPAVGQLVTQAQTSPCVIVSLPAGRYAAVELRDSAGTVRVRSTPAIYLAPGAAS